MAFIPMPRFEPLGDRAIMITLGDSIDLPTHRRVRAVTERIATAALPGVVDLVPAFASVAVHYDPALTNAEDDQSPYERLLIALRATLDDVEAALLPEPPLVEIPVCYGGELGPDLDDVAARHGMSADEVVSIHSEGDYLVYMVGFMPGFAYLGGLDDRITTPRRASPRKAVPAGSVGIGGQQTGVYPIESPGGWSLIGRTPLRIFDFTRDPETLLATGDRVRFRPISPDEFQQLRTVS